MKAIHKAPTRAAKSIAAQIADQSEMMAMLNLDELEFYNHQLAAGRALLKQYFGITGAANQQQLIDMLTKQLLTNKSHGYWAWFINQKQRHDALLISQFRDVFADETDLDYIRNEYLLEYKVWIRDSSTHNKLRCFINQSKTLFT